MKKEKKEPIYMKKTKTHYDLKQIKKNTCL